MKFSFFLSKRYSKSFLENYRCCQKSGNDGNSRGRRGHSLCVIMIQCVRKSICDSPLSQNYWNMNLDSLRHNIYISRYQYKLWQSVKNSDFSLFRWDLMAAK